MRRLYRKSGWSTVLLALIVSGAGSRPTAVAGMLNPADYASLGSLPDDSATYSFQTDGSVPVLYVSRVTATPVLEGLKTCR